MNLDLVAEELLTIVIERNRISEAKRQFAKERLNTLEAQGKNPLNMIWRPNRRKTSPSNKTSEETIEKIRSQHAQGMNMVAISKTLGLGYSTVRKIIRGY
jgi:DNA invertase Pin-like site-specific DNA recombinase